MNKKCLSNLLVNVGEIIRINIKISISYNVITAIFVMVFGLVVFDANDLSLINYYKLCEYLMVFIFPILFAGVGDIDCINHMWEMTFCKSIGYMHIYVFRIMFLVVIGILINAVPFVFLMTNEKMATIGHLFGGLIASIWLGLVELWLIEIFGNRQLAIGMVVMYYLLESITKGNITRNFQIMGYCNGNEKSKEYLLLASSMMCLILIISVFYKVRGYYGNKDRGSV